MVPERILVTGGTGFIGSAVVRLALEAGARVAVLTRDPGLVDGPAELSAIGGGMKFPDRAGIEKFNPQACIHCAWVATPGVYAQSPENSILAGQSLRLARSLASRGLGVFVGVGSCFEYASSHMPLAENSPRDMSNPYARAKACVFDGLSGGLPGGCAWAWARVFHAYGAGEHPARFTSVALSKILAGERLHVRRPEDVVDYTHLNDIATALLLLAGGEIEGAVNIGTGSPLTVREMTAMIGEACGRPVNADFSPQTDIVSRHADIARLRGIGWKPRVDRHAALCEMAAHVGKGRA